MLFSEIRNMILDAVRDYPFEHMHRLIEKSKETSRFSVWDCCFRASKACGGTYEMAIPAGAATFCMLVSIHLVDDLLDEDANGFFHKIGEASTANLALFFQSLGYKILNEANVSSVNRKSMSRRISRMNMDTCLAQQQDNTIIPKDESDYWKIAEAKTPPLFQTALYIGALSANGSIAMAETISQLGFAIGKIIQIGDDLSDVFGKEITPDWKKQFNNLPLLYANLADYEEKAEMKTLLADIQHAANLEKAQDILINSGAVSYCLYQMALQYRNAAELIPSMNLPDATELTKMMDEIMEGPKEFLKQFNISPGQILSMPVGGVV